MACVSPGSGFLWVSGEGDAWEESARIRTSSFSSSLLTCVIVWTIVWVLTQFLAQAPFPWFSPLLLWACLQVAYKVLFVVRVKQAILWAATLWLQAVTVVQSQEPSWSGRGTDGACSLEYCTLIFEGKKGSKR